MACFAVLCHLVPFAFVSSALYCGSGYQMMHKKANPTLLKFYEYKQGLKSLSPEGEGFNQLGDYKKDRVD